MTQSFPMFRDLMVILGTSLPVLFLFRKIGLPPIAGFVMTGIIIGPYGLGWIPNEVNVQNAAEIGVVLLLFTIGLEFSLGRLLNLPLRSYLIAAGQIVVTVCLGFLAAITLDVSFNAAVIVGFVLALSSSAIVLKGLSDRGELETSLGRTVVAICLAQDFAIIPMIVITGILSTGKSDLASVGATILQVLAFIGVLYIFARYILPRLLQWLVGMKIPEVVLLVTILILLGTAWFTSLMGLSLALGAFAAGLILAETAYYPQIYSEVEPFRALFSSIFFVSIGMLLDLGFVAAHPFPVFGISLGVFLLKAIVVIILCLLFRSSPRESIQGGLYIAQIGEFSFLIMGMATAALLITASEFQYLIAAAGITMAITPIIMQWAPRFAQRAELHLGFLSKPRIERDEQVTKRPQPSVLIVGYGVNGRNVSRVLREAGIYHEILEHNPEIVRQGRVEGEYIHYGDVARTEVLRQLDLEEFDSVVVAISDAAATRRAVSVIRSLHQDVHLIARTRYVVEVEELEKLGANVVVPEEFETSLRIFSDLLHHYRVPPHIIAMQVELARGQSYGLLRAKAGKSMMDNLERLLMARLVEAVPVTDATPAIGKSPTELGLSGTEGCMILALLRKGFPVMPPVDTITIQSGDLLVLYGNHADLNKAISRINTGV